MIITYKRNYRSPPLDDYYHLSLYHYHSSPHEVSLLVIWAFFHCPAKEGYISQSKNIFFHFFFITLRLPPEPTHLSGENDSNLSKVYRAPSPGRRNSDAGLAFFGFKWFFIAISLMFNENLDISGVSSHGIDISAFEFWQPLSHRIGSKFYKFCTSPKNSEFQFSYWSVQKRFHLIEER